MDYEIVQKIADDDPVKQACLVMEGAKHNKRYPDSTYLQQRILMPVSEDLESDVRGCNKDVQYDEKGRFLDLGKEYAQIRDNKDIIEMYKGFSRNVIP